MTITVGPSVITFNDSTTLGSAPGPYVGGRGQIFTASGTFTIPSGITAIKVTVQGGGATGESGFYGNCCTAAYSGAGGAAGATAIKLLTGLTPGATIGVTVGGAGGASSVQSGTQSITTVTAAASGGSATNGDINITGGQGDGRKTGPGAGTGAYTMFGAGGRGAYGQSVGNAARGYGSGGGGGGYKPPLNPVNYAGGAGAPGIVIFEW